MMGIGNCSSQFRQFAQEKKKMEQKEYRIPDSPHSQLVWRKFCYIVNLENTDQ
jgi:hypothetical protein